jgi:hypothetical protein
VKTGFISIKAMEFLWDFGRVEWGKWKVKWKSEKWKLYLWYHYIKKPVLANRL